jgi:DNA-binding Lrp family transcriptional regulator
MPDQLVLRPSDVAVALRLAEVPEATYEVIQRDLNISKSTAHQSVRRLQAAGLLRPESRTVNRLALLEFLEHGIRYAFPALRGALERGVPTAHAAQPLSDELDVVDALIWPSEHGDVMGTAIVPLYDHAAELPKRCPSLYGLLTLADALRIGRSRDRKLALAKLRERLPVAA